MACPLISFYVPGTDYFKWNPQINKYAYTAGAFDVFITNKRGTVDAGALGSIYVII